VLIDETGREVKNAKIKVGRSGGIPTFDE